MASDPIPSSKFQHIDRAGNEPIAQCSVCRQRLAFRHYYGMPVCFVCEQKTSNVALSWELQGGLVALSIAMHEFYPDLKVSV